MNTLSTILNPAPMLAIGGGALVTALIAIIPIIAACWLLLRAGGGRGLRQASTNDLGGLGQELQDNYERLRRSPEAIPLNVTTWHRLRDRLTTLPAEIEQTLRRTYRTIEVSNHVLTTVDAYDHRGGLAVRQRRMALWSTLEAAVRTSMQALDLHPTPARQVGPRLVEPLRTARVATQAAPQAFTLDRAPRLTIFYAPATEQSAASAAAGNARRPQPAPRPHRKAAVRNKAAEGQMPLWESVA